MAEPVKLLRRGAVKALNTVGINRQNVADTRMGVERHAIAALGQSRRREGGRILCYHSVGQPAWGTNDVPPEQFRKQIEQALEAGFRFVPARDIVKTGGGPRDLAITFDDGMKSVMTQAAPIMKDYNIPWTVFVVSEWSDGNTHQPEDTFMSWKDIEAVMKDGADVGSHSATHPQFQTIDREQMITELAGSRDLFEKRIGYSPDTFAIPYGQSMNWTSEAHEIAKEVGYSIIYAQAEETRPADTVARTFVTRFDHEFIFNALLKGKFDRWEEWS